MRLARRRTAMVLMASMCGGAWLGLPRAHGGPLEDSGAQKTVSDLPVAARILEAAFNEDQDGARLVLAGDAPLVYTAYESRPDLLIVDLPGIGLSEKFVAPSMQGILVQSVRIETMSELGKSLTRLTISHREGVPYDIRSVGQGLAISFDAPRSAAIEPTSSPPPVAESAPTASVAEKLDSPAATPVRGELAHVLEEVRATMGVDSVQISLLGDGVFAAKDFVLENPPRLVIDLPGVKNEVRHRVLPVKSRMVSRVRISQFQSAPDLVTRVVVDLDRPLPHTLSRDGERLAILVGGGAAPMARDDSPSRTELAPAAAPPVAASDRAGSGAIPAGTSASSGTGEVSSGVTSLSARTDTAAQATAMESRGSAPEAAPPEQRLSSAAAASQGKEPEPVLSQEKPHPEAPAMEEKRGQEAPAPSTVAAPPSSGTSREKQRVGGSAGRGSREEALFEAAAAVLDQEEAGRPIPSASFQPRTIAEVSTQFTGEPISLDLKDADIKDVFRTISELTQLNIVIDPEVRGTVTVKLEDVPWDQALDLILKQNSLGYVLENNIMRIATTAKLQAEQADRARLAEARQSAEPTRTVIKKLSYAKAGEITATIKSVMSRRGDIVVDTRTNTLVIREIPSYLPAVLQLIENLDTATPQVMIESRIVETTKSLGKSLGISWGFSGAADVAHGNTTNLSFPNNIDFQRGQPQPFSSGARGFQVSLPAGTPLFGIRLGNILDSFNLDAVVSAAENQGLLKIISSPKVAALTNTAASIQSGVQIPVQTTVNNTTTVQYVDATLKLSVTPQITNEGTIVLDVNVSKREPAVALNLALGNNVPLTIREYRGQILVRDGGTAVIGGIFQINDQDQNNMIPGLWKIPILGNLFRSKTRTEKHDELLIFITPRILRS